jgi:putative toxin-antitoxin system antitoxin component (TIGR02293 family)
MLNGRSQLSMFQMDDTIYPFGTWRRSMAEKLRATRRRSGDGGDRFTLPGESAGLHIDTSMERVRRIEQGLPFAAFERFRASTSLPASTIARLIGLPASTMHRRRGGKRLKPRESESLFRVAQLFEKTLEMFDGDRAAAISWLQSPRSAFDGRTPLDLARSEAGAREVEALIGRLEHGVFT